MEPIRQFIGDYSHGISHRGTETREEALYVCDVCGPVEPYHVKLTGRWLRQQCHCEIEARQRRALLEWRQMQAREMARLTYDWLGDGRDDLPLCEKTFENFHEARQATAYDAALTFCADMEGRSLVLASETFGTGKTHLLAAICNELRAVQKLSRFTPAPKFFRAISERIAEDRDYSGLIRAACNAPLLVLDDVDKATPSQWKMEIFYEILDERTKHGRATALSTNRLADLDRYIGGAACSRLSIGQIAVEMTGADFRMEM